MLFFHSSPESASLSLFEQLIFQNALISGVCQMSLQTNSEEMLFTAANDIQDKYFILCEFLLLSFGLICHAFIASKRDT